MGRLKDEETMTEQAYRYPKETWGTGEARSHCEDHDGILFEPAEGEAVMEREQFWNSKPSPPLRRPDRYLYSIQEHAFINEDEIEVIATTGLPNRLNEVLPALALKTENYLKNPVVLWAHDWNQLPIGKTTQLKPKGEKMIHRVQFSPLELGQQVKLLYKQGFLNAWSYGFVINSYEDLKKDGIRKITDAELLELSAVNVPADAGALSSRAIYAMPNLELGNGIQFRGAIPYKETPKADEGEAWDAGKEVAAADAADLKIMCAWYDAEYPNIKASYKLPHHKASGEHAVVWRAVSAAGAALMGARGGVDIPSGDVDGVKSHLGRHYEEFDKEPPWEREGSVSSWDRHIRRMEHLTKELKTGRRDSPVDLEMLQEIMSITLDLRANIGQEELVAVMKGLGEALGKDEANVNGVLDSLSARLISTGREPQTSKALIEGIRSIYAEQSVMRKTLERLGS